MNAKEATFWCDRRVFVTGATGMVGSWLVRSLLDVRARVIALVRDPDPQSDFYRNGDYRRVAIVQGRIEDFESIERALNKHEVDTVFHLAAQPIVSVAHRYPLATFESNIRGTYNLLEACRVHSDLVHRIVIASSDKAYGAQERLPYTEEMPLQGQYPYEVSKSCADLLAQTYYSTYALPVAILRGGNIYGGGDLNWSRIVPYTIRCLLNGQQPVIRSDGQFVRDYIYVKDVVSCYMKAAEQLSGKGVQGEAFNFGLEHPVTVLEVVSTITRLMNCEHIIPIVKNIASGEIRSQYLSSSKARDLLMWKPQYTLDAGLGETISWYRQYLLCDNNARI